jgi:hypothetical protein
METNKQAPGLHRWKVLCRRRQVSSRKASSRAATAAVEPDKRVPMLEMDTTDLPWIPLAECARQLGMTVKSAHNCLLMETLPVPTYKIGKRRVVDKGVMAEFFRLKREQGLETLAKR